MNLDADAINGCLLVGLIRADQTMESSEIHRAHSRERPRLTKVRKSSARADQFLTSIAVTVPAAASSGSVVVNAGGAASNQVQFTVSPAQ